MDPKTGKSSFVDSPFKRSTIRALTWGAGCGLVLSLVLLSVYFYTQRPKGWDTQALRVKNTKAEALFRMDERLQETSSGVIFTVDLENATAADITLPSTLTIMQARKGSGALHGSLLKLDREHFIPAHHVVSITLENDDLCAAKADPQSCYDSYFKDEGEIVIFEKTHRYEVHISVPALTPPRNETVTGVPVQKG